MSKEEKQTTVGGNPKVSKEDIIAAAKLNKKVPIWGGHGDVNRMLKDNGLPELYSEEDEIKHKISKLNVNTKIVKPQGRQPQLIKSEPEKISKPSFYLVHGEKVKVEDEKKNPRSRNNVESRDNLKHMFLKDVNETEPEENG